MLTSFFDFGGGVFAAEVGVDFGLRMNEAKFGGIPGFALCFVGFAVSGGFFESGLAGFEQGGEALKDGIGGTATAGFVERESVQSFEVRGGGFGNGLEFTGEHEPCGDGVEEGHLVELLDGDLVEAPIEIGGLLDQAGFLLGGGGELFQIGDAVGFVGFLLFGRR